MFDTKSRYTAVSNKTLTIIDAAGELRLVNYKARRKLPPRGVTPTLVEHVVKQGDRLDNVTARYIADPTQFWRVCDANVVKKPGELTSQSGRVIEIPLPGIG